MEKDKNNLQTGIAISCCESHELFSNYLFSPVLGNMTSKHGWH